MDRHQFRRLCIDCVSRHEVDVRVGIAEQLDLNPTVVASLSEHFDRGPARKVSYVRVGKALALQPTGQNLPRKGGCHRPIVAH